MNKKRIVIVEDERIIAEDIKGTLLSYNYNVLDIFARGEDAIANILELKPDLVLMDIVLAGEINGIQTALKIQELVDVPVIYLTAYANENILEGAKITQPYGYLIKPFQERELYATIEMAFYRYKLEHDLKSNEKKYRILFNSIADPVFIFSKNDDHFLDCNDAVQKIYGYSKSELSEMTPYDLHSKDEFEKVAQYRNTIIRQPQNYHHYKKNGEMLIVNILTNDIIYEGKSARMSIIHDITEITRAEQILQKTQLRLSTIFQNVPNIILYETGEDRQFISENVNELLGYSQNNVIKNKKMFLDLIHEEEREIVAEKTKLWNFNKSEEMLMLWYRVKNTSGQNLWIEDRMIHVTPENGEAYVTGVLIDNSELKNAVAEKEKIREQLYQSQKMEVVGKLAGGIAHDFNNLLTAINGYADIALKKLPETSAVNDDIKVIKDCGLKAAKLTQQLLGFSRKQIVERKLIDLNLIISELLKMLNRLIGENIKLELKLYEKPSLVLADSGQIEQVLINLVVNARDAMPEGGIITIATSRKIITETEMKLHQLENPGEFVKISVIDTGTGMTEEVEAQIFEPFFTTKEIGKGTGLGLATVFGIIKQNEGFIDVETEIGLGTTFQVYLPSSKEQEIIVSEPESVANIEPQQGEETILLVEDEEAIREFVSSILEESGYKVLEADGGEKGLQISDNYDGMIHLLLSDIRMPKMSGPELARKLKQKHPETKLLFVSGHTDNEAIRKEIGDSYCGFLQKPFSYEGLLSKIRAELNKPKVK
ncbi:MAG: response regulator [Candidatus Cloacimonadales bacterium]|nr:response regulator [Candidatus Cloacimonadales bacterium]